MKKEDILKILQDGWEGYKTRILPNSYLYLYNDGQGIKTKQVAVRDFNFLHLSGVKSKLSAEIFTRKLRKKTLKQSDFYVVDKSYLNNKLKKLAELPDVVEQAHKIGSRLQDLKNVDYLIGKNDVVLGLAKSKNGNGADTPSSLMSGDWNKIATNSCEILAILCMPKQGKKVYNKVTYCKQGEKINVEQLPKSIKQLCSQEVLIDLSNGRQSHNTAQTDTQKEQDVQSKGQKGGSEQEKTNTPRLLTSEEQIAALVSICDRKITGELEEERAKDQRQAEQARQAQPAEQAKPIGSNMPKGKAKGKAPRGK